ncbi:MAG: glycosyltransferase [Erysipelotrichaceae bacterium]|nr:glycosyltransferase [Erysipelotrichaceae bacterium]
MNEDILISVIVPAYNSEKWISSCLDSILSQTYSYLEVIVINDGSIDSTGKIIDDYSLKDDRIIPIHQENKGLVRTREVGISIAKGEYVTFVDSDDTVAKNMYEKLLNNAVKYNADISHCGMSYCFEDEIIKTNADNRIFVQNNFEGMRDLLVGEIIEPSLCNKLYKKELLVDSCLDLTVLNNEDLLRNYILFSRSQKSVFENFGGYHYLQRDNSMSKNNLKIVQMARHIAKARKLIVNDSKKNHPETYPYAMRSWLNCYVNFLNQMAFSDDKDVQKYWNECRVLLKKEKSNFKYLIRRQQIAAWLIVLSPKLHQIVYKVYSKKG